MEGVAFEKCRTMTNRASFDNEYNCSEAHNSNFANVDVTGYAPFVRHLEFLVHARNNMAHLVGM